MFCPQCGQQQASDAARFCSRCGFQLDAVSGLLLTGGVPPAYASQGELVPESPRRKGARLGGKVMLTGLFLAPALGLASELIGTPDELAIIGIIIFLAGIFRLLYALIFEQGTDRSRPAPTQGYVPPAQFAPPRQASALPPQQTTPAHGYVPPRADTGEIVYRPSVTEGTTRLLDKELDEQSRRNG